MEKTIYPPLVEDFTEKFIDVLTKSKFFENNEITNLEPAREILNKWLLTHFIDGTLSEGEPIPCTEEEMRILLGEIITESALLELKELGFIETFYDETSDDDVIWLTEKGKEAGKRLFDSEKS